MSTTVGTAYYQLMPSTEGIKGSITKALNGEALGAGESSGKSIAGGIAKTLKVGMAAVGASTVAMSTAFVTGAKGVANYGDNVDKMSQKLGLSASAYQKWDYVMNLAGTDMQSMTTGLKTLTNKLDAAKNGNKGAQDSFKKLGISMGDIKNMSREELFAKSIEGLQGMKDSTERAALANELFGRSGQNLTPLFNQSSKSTKALMDQAEKYGMIMSDDLVKASADFNDSMTTMNMTMNGLKNRVMGEYLPSMTQVTNGMGKLFAGDMSGIEDISNGIQSFIGKMSEQLPGIMDVGIKVIKSLVEGIIDNLPQLLKCGAQMLVGISEAVISLLPSLIRVGSQIVVELANGIVSYASSFMDSFDTLIETAIEWLNTEMPVFLAKGVDIVANIANGIISDMPAIISGIGTIISGLLDLIMAALPQLAVAGGNLIGQLAIGIVTNAPSILMSAAGVVANIIGKILSAIPQLLSAGIKFLGAFASGLVSAGPKVLTSIANVIRNVIAKLKTLPGQMLTIAKNAITKFASAFSPSAVIAKINTIISSILTKLKALPGKVASALASIPKKLAEAFKFSIPKIKLPHFSIGGKFSLFPPKAPTFSVKWYKSAMGKPMLLNQPTLFGASNGQLLGGGEAGSELIYGHDALMRDIANASSDNSRIESLLAQYLPLILSQMDSMQVVLDDGTLVGRVEKDLISTENRRRLAWK